MKSGDVATPVDTLDAEVKRLEQAYANAVSQVDKEQILRDKEAAEDAANKAKKPVTKVSSTKKKKKSKKQIQKGCILTKFVIDFNKDIPTEWKKQSEQISSHIGPDHHDKTVLATSTIQTINPSLVEISNFFNAWDHQQKLSELFKFIKLKSWVSLNFKDAANLVFLEEFKCFNKVQFDIFPLRIDLSVLANVNKLFTDLKQLLQLKNMTIVCNISQEKPCQKLVNMLQYILVLKNKNYPGTVLFE